jgi:type VI secretion system protein ImpL
MNIYWASGGVFVIYMVSSYVIAGLTRLTGSDLWILRSGLASLGITSYAIFYWWLQKREAAKQQQAAGAAAAGAGAPPAAGAAGVEEVDLLIREAEARLAASKLAQEAKLSGLPVIVLLGDPGTTKTTAIVRSGMEPELLAGQVYQDNNVVPTRGANIWFARQAIFVDTAGRLAAEPARWVKMIKKLQPGKLRAVVGRGGQAPRAAIVFVDLERLMQAGEQAAVMARNLQARLGEISQTLGINFPVYVLFAKIDRMQFFAEWVRTLNNEEAAQVFGATLPPRPANGRGVYAEEESRRLAWVFNELFYSVCDKRIELLGREHDPEKLPFAYEYPREFRKARDVVVQFLVDLCRPSQLRANPFLRGFYFSGVRAIFVTEQASLPATPRLPTGSAFQGAPASGATSMFQVGPVPQAMPTPQSVAQPTASVTKKVPQWVFLPHFFNSVVLQDRAAMGASGASTRASGARRALLAAAAALCLLFAVGFTWSFFNNRALESRALEAARGVQVSDAVSGQLPALDALKRLETLRATLEQLTLYEREGAPLGYRWFLYAGSDMYPHVRRIYYNKFHLLMFGQTQAALLAHLQKLPAAAGPNDEYGPTYDTLKAYLITTSHHEKSTRNFLSPFLMGRWLAGRELDPERRNLAQKQWDFYSEDLKIANPYSSENDAAAVDRARRYLASFSGIERVYQFMLAEANRNNPPVNFNQKFPGSAEVVINNRDVPGAFTKQGFAWMQSAIKKADQYFGGERWVLGDYAPPIVDRVKVEKDLTDRYEADFIAQWRGYFKNSTVVRYANLRDAANKLMKTSGNQSPLLALFWLASRETNVDSQKVKDAFDATYKVVPPSEVMQFIGATNQSYMNALMTLQSGIEQAASAPAGPDPNLANQTLQQAMAAKLTTRQVANTFRVDPEANLHQTTQKLMEDPITWAEALLRGIGPAELNAKARALCAGFTFVNKFPFNPVAQAEATLQEVATIFKPKEGTLWVFYESSLRNVLPKQGTEYVAAPGGGLTLNPQFVFFFNQAAKFSEALYPGNAAEPRLTYSLRPMPSDQFTAMTLVIDGQSTTFTGQAGAKQYVWPSRELRLGGRLAGGSEMGLQDRQGLWSAFRFFADADRFEPGAGGYNLTWVVRQGREAQPVRVGGRELIYRFFLDMGGAPAVFDKNFLASLKCISQAAR